MDLVGQGVLMRPDRTRVSLDATFGDFYLENFPRLVVLATTVAGDATFAEDIVQDVMGRAHARWSELLAYDSPGAWVRRAVVNQAIDRKRRLVREAKVLARLGRSEARVTYQPRSNQELWEAVNRLPANQRAAIALHYLEGYPTAEIATTLGCADATARTLLHRARATLRLDIDRTGRNETARADVQMRSAADDHVIDLTGEER